MFFMRSFIWNWFHLALLRSKRETAPVYAKATLNFTNLLLLLSYTNSLSEEAIGVKKKIENPVLNRSRGIVSSFYADFMLRLLKAPYGPLVILWFSEKNSRESSSDSFCLFDFLKWFSSVNCYRTQTLS